MTPMELGDYWDRGYIIEKPKKDVYSFERYEGTEPDVVIPDCVSIIAKSAFAKNQYLQSVVIPEGITEIPEKAFYGCTALRRAVLPSTLKVIGDSAFTGCRLLEASHFRRDFAILAVTLLRMRFPADCDSGQRRHDQCGCVPVLRFADRCQPAR